MIEIFRKKDPNKVCQNCDHSLELKRLEEEIISIQKAQANLRKDIPAIIRQTMKDILEHRNRRVYPL